MENLTLKQIMSIVLFAIAVIFVFMLLLTWIYCISVVAGVMLTILLAIAFICSAVISQAIF